MSPQQPTAAATDHCNRPRARSPPPRAWDTEQSWPATEQVGKPTSPATTPIPTHRPGWRAGCARGWTSTSAHAMDMGDGLGAHRDGGTHMFGCQQRGTRKGGREGGGAGARAPLTPPTLLTTRSLRASSIRAQPSPPPMFWGGGGGDGVSGRKEVCAQKQPPLSALSLVTSCHSPSRTPDLRDKLAELDSTAAHS